MTWRHIVLSKDPTSDCYMRLTIDFISIPKRNLIETLGFNWGGVLHIINAGWGVRWGSKTFSFFMF